MFGLVLLNVFINDLGERGTVEMTKFVEDHKKI